MNEHIRTVRDLRGRMVAVSGLGNGRHLFVSLRAASVGLSPLTFQSVPFAGDGPSVSALLGGHVMILGGSSVAVTSYVQAKRMRVLLVNDKGGLDYVPEALSFEKAGYDVESTTAVITFGPRALPGPVVDRLARAFNEAAKSKTLLERRPQERGTRGRATHRAGPGRLAPEGWRQL
jgi:tripartite-type tricarboxylate transporter receptor subunit TctC